MPDTKYTGVFPIAPTTFDDRGEIDMPSQLRAIDYMIDSGVDGICILANFSEQFALTDDEREQLTTAILEHAASRVPIIVTTSHYSSKVAAERSRRAQDAGAKMVMLMPPYHGATFRADDAGIRDFYKRVADAIDIPIMVQDAPVSGTPLSAPFLAQLAREIDLLRYFKIEMPGAASKLRALIELAGDTIDGPFDGEESITLLADLDAGATGTMPSGIIGDVLGKIVRLYLGGDRDGAIALYERYLPLINYENRQCGLRATKALMKEGGIIASEATRHPMPPLPAPIRAGLIELGRRLDLMILRWAK
jgi:dihydrodipicolinate synthase/N-acetylneuraminate lyase